MRYSIVDAKEAAERLRECLPPSLPVGLGGRHGPGPTGLLFAIALRAELMGEALSIGHYQTVETQGKRGDSDPAKFNDKDLDRNLRPALSWLSTWAKYALGDLDPKSIVTVIETYAKRHSYDDIWSKPNRVARQVLPLLAVASEDESVTAACRQVIQMIAADAPIVGTLDLLPGLRGDARFAEEALELSNSARQALFNTAEPADNKAETLVHIARGLHRFSPAEAGSYFDQAVNAAAGVGDDAIHRWDAIVALTRAAAGIDQVDAISLAERVAHLGETVDSVVYKGFDQRKLVAALALVSGANVLRILGQWRDRRFGMLDWQFRGLVEGDKALFASRPDLTTILAPFLTNFDLNTALRKLDASGSLNVKALSAANNLANRLGCSVDTEFAQFLLPDAPRADDTDEFRNSAFDLISEKRAERATQVQIDEYKVQIATLDLTKLNDLETAVRLQQEASLYSGSLIAEVFTRPMFQWGQILDVAVGSDALSYYELTELLNEALTRPRIAQSFVDSLQKAVTTYVDRYGARLLQQNWMIFDLSAAADLLEIRTVDLLQRALDHLNLEEALTDADHCYMLAAGASAVLDPPTAARVLREALAAFERELVVHPITVIEQAQSEPIDIAVANFLWAALGDPRSAVRWQAAHAVRTAIELGASDVIDALSSAVIRGDVAGYADGRFPYYEMNAAEWFLVAVERVSRDDPSAIDALLSAVIELSDRYPDHAIIQEHCASITRLIATPIGFVGTDWKATLAEPKVLEVRHRPTHPRPMMKGAPQSEHRFRFDFDEYVLGKLTKTLVTKHQEVLDFASTLILDDWGWRGKDGHIEDPRRTAGVYEDGETYGYKREVPKAEDLVYYLERHAALTVAGKLMRTTTPYCDPDAEQPDVLAWLADFNVARNDGRWITDQRSSVPGSLASVGPRGSNQVLESEFLTALEPTDGWVTIWQSASVTEYDRSLNIDIATALVNPETAGALARALQTADSYWSFRIPLADPGDEDFQFSSSPFQLCGWVSMPDTEGSGIDRLDPLATELMAELARPSSDIVKMFNLSSRDGGLHWENQDGVINFVSETWADISLGSELHGPSGNRLRITTEALDQTLRRLEATLIAEVRVKREDRSTRYLGISGNNDEEGDNEHDSDFRVFTYQPGTGWRDFSGRVGTR